MSATDPLDRIQVNKPCDADWDSMTGNDQVRFCEHCSLTVHDLSQMTRKRARRLVAKSNGRLCVRYTRRPDGSLVSKAVPQKLFRIGRRASRIAAGAFSATLSLSGAVTLNARERSNVYQGRAVAAYQDPSRQVYSGSAIVGTITDANGAVIVNATVSLSNDQRQFTFVTSSNSQGEYRFEGLAPGAYYLSIEAVGFDPVESQGVYLAARSTQRADRQLQVATIREEVEIQGSSEASQGATMGVVATAIVEPSEPLVKAAQEDEFLEMLAVLTRENVNVRDKATGTTALEHAVRNGNREMLQALISVGADVNSRNDSKETVLMMLGEEATADMVWDLIHAGAKLDLKDDEGDTALIEAAMVNNLAVLQTLLQAGANVNLKNDEGQTALMLAASNDRMKNVKALIAAGADMNARDNKGKTALNYAKDEDNEKIVKLLQSYGAIEGTPQEDK